MGGDKEIQDITLKICPVKLSDIEVVKPADAANAVEYDQLNKLIIIAIQPVNTPPPVGEIIVPLLKGFNEDYLPKEPDGLTSWYSQSSMPYYCEDDTWIWWEQEQDEKITEYGGEHPLEPYPTLSVRYPECCHFTGLTVKIFGPKDIGVNGSVLWDHQINVSEKGGAVYGEHVTQNIIVPGMKIAVFHNFFDGTHMKEVAAGATYWCTCCFTGGKIVQISGEYGDPDISYIVEIEDQYIECKSTDFAQYEVGDWVFVQKASQQCEQTERNVGCKNGCIGGTDENEMSTLKFLINDARMKAGIVGLEHNEMLNSAAQKHSDDQGKNCFMGHIGTDSSTYDQRITAAGYIKDAEAFAVGENVAIAKNITNAFKAWKNSSGHWANIMNPVFREMGFGSVSLSECAIIKDKYHGVELHYEETDPDTGEIKPKDHGLKIYTNTFGYVKKKEEVPPEVPFRIVPLKIGAYGD